MITLIEPCRIRHLHAIAAQLRAEELSEIALFRTKPRHALLACYRQTPEPWACVVDDGVAAVWGDSAPVLASEGNPWCFTSSLIERIPLFFFREVRRQLRQMLESRQTLRSDVGEGCAKALRFYGLVGFKIAPATNGLHMITMSRGEI